METGQIQVWVYTSRAKIPVEDATVVMSFHHNKTRTEKEDIFAVEVTDFSGNTAILTLPVPNEEVSTTPDGGGGFALLDVWVEHPEFVSQKIESVQIFPEIETILPVQLYPLGEGKSSLGNEIQVELPVQNL